MVGSSDLEALELHLARLRMVVFATALGAVGFFAIAFLVASVLIEGAVFFLAMAYLLERRPFTLAPPRC